MNANNLYCISNRKYKFIVMLLGIYVCKKKNALCLLYTFKFIEFKK